MPELLCLVPYMKTALLHMLCLIQNAFRVAAQFPVVISHVFYATPLQHCLQTPQRRAPSRDPLYDMANNLVTIRGDGCGAWYIQLRQCRYPNRDG
eukprot:4299763-Amphidinium_carterae.1